MPPPLRLNCTPGGSPHGSTPRGLLTPESDLDSAVIIADPLTGLPLSVVHLVPMEADDGSIVMLPRIPVPPPAYVAPVPCPAW